VQCLKTMSENIDAFRPMQQDYFLLLPTLLYQDAQVSKHALAFLSNYLNLPVN